MRPFENRHSDVRKTVAVIGGILGLEPQYKRILEENNYLPRIYNQDSARLSGRVEGTDTIILFTGTVSHKMAEKVRKVAHLRDIPLVTVRRSSISALRQSIEQHFIPEMRKSEANQEINKFPGLTPVVIRRTSVRRGVAPPALPVEGVSEPYSACTAGERGWLHGLMLVEGAT